MSAVRSNIAKVRGPNCPHCANLGLNSNHWLRKSPEPNSPIVCPILLATTCKYCNKPGHTAGYCQVKKQEMKTAEKEIRTAKYFEKTAPVVEKVPNKSVFAILDEPSSDKKTPTKTNEKKSNMGKVTIGVKSVVGEKRSRVEMDFPKLVSRKTNEKKTENLVVSYSEMVTKPVLVEEKPKASKPDKIPNIRTSWADDESDDERTKLCKSFMVRRITASWADDDAWASSDDEEYWSDEECHC
jgi:hypothetical protein